MKSMVLNHIKAGMTTGLFAAFIVYFIQILNTLVFFSYFGGHIKDMSLYFLCLPLLLYAGIFVVLGIIFGLVYGFIRRRGEKPSAGSLTVFLSLFILPVYGLLLYYWTHFSYDHVIVEPFFRNFSTSLLVVIIFLLIWLYLSRSALLCTVFREKKHVFRLIGSFLLFFIFTAVILVPTFPRSGQEKFNNGAVSARSGESEKRFNVILITLDTLRRDFLGCYGNSSLDTPNIDALAARGVQFNRAVVHAPITLTSHTSLLTSLYPTSHGVRSNARFKAAPELKTLPEMLLAEGYQTAAFVSAMVLDSIFGLDQGFLLYDDEFNSQQEKMLLFYKNRITVLRLFEKCGWMTFPILADVERNAEEVTDAVLQWMNEKKDDRPFFIWLHYFDPHAPLKPPEPYRLKHLETVPDGLPEGEEKEILTYRALYRAEIEFTDSQLGKLFDMLERTDALADTLLVLTADHGQSISEHGYTGHTDSVHFTTLNCPLIFSCPGLLPLSVQVDAFVRSIDVMPTILDLLEIDGGVDLEGRSLVPLMIEREDGEPWEPVEASYAETLYQQNPEQALFSIQTEEWKLITDGSGSKKELYQITRDPEEKFNLAAERPRLTEQLAGHLQDLVRRTLSEERSVRINPDQKIRDGLKALGYME